MHGRTSVRLEWSEIPQHVRADLESMLGASVVEAVNQPGGFSPSFAARCVLEDGRRVFIKAVSPAQNPDSADMVRFERAVTAAFPAGYPAPVLLDAHDDGDWVGLVFEDVEGRQPALPWDHDELGRILAAVDDLAARSVPCPVPDLRSIGDYLGGDFSGWRKLAAGDGEVDRLDDWSRAHLDVLAQLEEGWEAAADGDALLHVDIRADNVLITRGR